jgi:hypothetical protein
MPRAAPTFTPSPYILLQVVTCTPIYTMDDSVLMEELRSLTEGHVPFFLGSSRLFSQMWFVNWSSNMVLITPRRLHSTIGPLCAV